uniref:Ig-like domain-containing protein n=1 Tax=Phocoena sinus TaxID=42100 RepID=A0A8C9CU22_PHOSS
MGARPAWEKARPPKITQRPALAISIVITRFFPALLLQPKVNVSPSKKEPLQAHNLLICHVTDFYPGHVQVCWFLNGQKKTAGVVSIHLIYGRDWTSQLLVMLEMTRQQGDVYPCHVEHPSLDRPVTVK